MRVTRENRGSGVILIAIAALSFLISAFAWADPSREEVYRNDELRIVVYKDGSDPNQYWYLPPLKWHEQNGQLLFYRRPRDGRTEYYFYVTPYMTPELFNHIASEIPNIQRESQLRPLILKRLGIRVPQFDATMVGQEATDYQYINSPQLLKLSLDGAKADDFEFFISNPPGIQTQVLFFYQAERVDRYINLELSCRDVYQAMQAGIAGQYEFLRGQIEDRVFEYIANRHLFIRSKGDIPLPAIIDRAIQECFVPVQPPRLAALLEDVERSGIRGVDQEELRMALTDQFNRFQSILEPVSYTPVPQENPVEVVAGLQPWDLSTPLPGTRPLPGSNGPVIGIPTQPPGGGTPGIGIPGRPTTPTLPGLPTTPIRPPGTPGTPTIPGIPGNQPGLGFAFRQDAATSDRSFYFRREQVANSEELSVAPLMLSLNPSAPPPNYEATPYPQRDLIVAHTHLQASPLSTGIHVQTGDQLLLNAVFSLYFESAYGDHSRRRMRWESSWPNTGEDLYYRIGNGPWTAVNGRAMIRTDNIMRGELQFYIDRPHIWEKIPSDLKDPSFFGILPAILNYRQTYPQFNVTITGRRVTGHPGGRPR